MHASNNSTRSALPKIKNSQPPVYKGRSEEDLFNWINEVNKCAQANGWTENDLVRIVPTLLKEAAGHWWDTYALSYNNNIELMKWKDICYDMKIHFESDYKTSLNQFKVYTMKQEINQDVSTFYWNLMAAARKYSISQDSLKSTFVNGLLPAIREKIRTKIHKPMDLLMEKAKIYEDAIKPTKTILHVESKSIKGLQEELSEVRTEINAINNHWKPAKKVALDRFAKQQDEIAQKMKNESTLCFRCGHTGHTAGNCTAEKPISTEEKELKINEWKQKKINNFKDRYKPKSTLKQAVIRTIEALDETIDEDRANLEMAQEFLACHTEPDLNATVTDQ